VPIEVKAGGASFHHYNTFHGSGPNTATVHRRAVISHLIPGDTEFHPVNADPVYSRYRKAGDMSMDESYFPVVWSRDGGRSDWLDAELAQDLGGVLAEPGHGS
jgi:ectoine hydroxylase-related dioxygenase (phytanoyl-CoA dioxygenase family)